ncbi:MAG TPA: class I adenylate-forming enzyme family protein [Acidimicrobiales bacterium]|nr:class I adenylate-forming enzyme family protein [Acidimicrobiales bacterium]
MTVRQIAGRSGSRGTVVDVLRAAAEKDPEAEAYVEMATPGSSAVVARATDGKRRLTFGQWDAAAEAVAGQLAERVVHRGDVVCLLLPSSIDYAVCYQAAARLGAVTSGLNLRLGLAEKRAILGRLRPKVTVADTGLVDAGELAHSAGTVLARTELTPLATSGTAGGGVRQPALHDDDPVCVVWTSGSTGVPKGAVFDHRNLQAVAAGTDVLSRPGDRRLSPLPFAHVGYMTRQWDEIAHGITTVVTPHPWSAESAIALMAGERVTVGQGVPTQWALVLRHPDLNGADLSALRIAGTGGARVPVELVRQMRRRLRCPVVVRYTSTETSLGTGTQPDDPEEVVCGSVGRPVPGVELTVVDENGAIVPAGEVGRVRLRSAAVMRGYAGTGAGIDRPATDSVLDAAGWLTTGDMGWIGPDGNLRLVGRASEMYIRGGYNVYPSEVETVLRSHPAVKEVAVVGVGDPVLGEIGVAFVVPAEVPGRSAGGSQTGPTLDELRQWSVRQLADYKAPDRLVSLAELPLTAMGKVDLAQLRQMAAAGLGEQLSATTKGNR